MPKEGVRRVIDSQWIASVLLKGGRKITAWHISTFAIILHYKVVSAPTDSDLSAKAIGFEARMQLTKTYPTA